MTEDVKDNVKETGSTEGADGIVKHYMLWSMGAGLIPLPVVDMAAIGGVQLKMLSELAEHYEVPFSQHKGKSILGALVGGVASGSLALGMGGSALKAIPFVGSLAGMLAMPVFAGATTYAVGKVFIQHFAAGGTFLDFDPDKVREFYEEKLAEGKVKAEEVKTQAKKPA